MARQQRDREDIMREATALSERIELETLAFSESIVAGFRRDGCGSIYFGPDKVFQFNTAGQLRRGYLDGRLVKADRGRLIALNRVRSDNEVRLLARSFDNQETTKYIATLQSDLTRLRLALERGEFQIVSQVPGNVDVVGRLLSWIESLAGDITIAHGPHAR